ncbi:adenylyl cyclase-associated protein 1-like isoform X2 [Dreissena polymorpha]|uniref:adenylyl cyclase-associated protein 1-like isoform X2 n=1 Tax=Dreissena polymorpha TaxID=45954 RepID=UPI0022642AC4|nr:adenylyl cyclase-associated protein 1-like isoform X2 [Dreissena polymorpha]
MSAEQMHQAVTRLEAVAARLESLAVSGVTGGSGSSGGAGGASTECLNVDPTDAELDAQDGPVVLAYDSDILHGKFSEFLRLSRELGGDLQTQVAMVEKGFQEVRKFIAMAGRSKKPDQNKMMELLKPLSEVISGIQEFRESKRQSPMFNHLSGVSEAIGALGWVSVSPTPGPYVKEMQDAGMFFTNRVIKDHKDSGPQHVEWTKAWMGTLRDLIEYIKQYHTTGVTWNPQGGEAKLSGAPAPPAKAAAGGAPPPPPPGPPPPPPVAPAAPPSGSGGEENRAALFAAINRGTAISSGLKKVSDDMKTHKNPALRATSAVTSSHTSSHGVRTGPAPFKANNPPPVKAPKPGAKAPAAPTEKPPVFELQEKKWAVEYQVGNKNIVVGDTNIKQTVYMYKCLDSTIVIKGKINSIVIDSCKKVAIAFDGVVSSIEFVNCQSVQAQVMGQCPTVSIDKTDGCMMYLSKESLDAEIVTAKSSEMNILVPKDDGDFAEFPLPEQFKTKWNGKKFITDCAESV